MRTYIFDQFEFERWESEERVEIAISRRGDFPHPTMARFADEVVGANAGAKLPAPKAFSNVSTFSTDAGYLARFLEIAVSQDCSWPCFVVEEEWNERHLLLDTGLFDWLRHDCARAPLTH
jgi:hypothetical protein